MPALRFLGALFLLLAVVILVADLTNTRGSAAGGAFVSLAKHWVAIAPGSLAASQRSVQAISPVLWDPVARSLLSFPAWALFAATGALLAYAGRRRRRVNIYTN
jgi:hypothetical protein